jgi:hypothetical protein
MRARQHVLVMCFVAAAACSSSEHVVGDQCPSPYSSTAGYKATVRDRDGSKGYFGTSCAPCRADDQIKYDKRGCPIFVTFETCGGPVCLAGYEVDLPAASDGGAENDSGTKDSGVEEDSGAQ